MKKKNASIRTVISLLLATLVFLSFLAYARSLRKEDEAINQVAANKSVVEEYTRHLLTKGVNGAEDVWKNLEPRIKETPLVAGAPVTREGYKIEARDNAIFYLIESGQKAAAKDLIRQLGLNHKDYL